MRRGASRVASVVAAAALYGLGAVATVAVIRPLLEPAWPWREPLIVALVVGLVALAARVIRRSGLRILVLGATVLVLVGALARSETGRAPWSAGLRGPDGLLSGEGYLAEVARLAEDAVLEWSTTLLPASVTEHPQIALMLWGIAGVAWFAIAAGLLTFRLPLLAVAGLALPVGVHVVVLAPERTLVPALGLVVFSLAALALAHGRASGGVPRTIGAICVLALLALAIAAGPARVDASAWPWRSWAPERPDPVSVQFVWNQTYRALDFPDQERVVIEVDAAVRANLRVATLERFNGLRWSTADRLADVGAAGSASLPDPAAVGIAVGEAGLRDARIRNVALDSRRVPVPPATVTVDDMTTDAGRLAVTAEGAFEVERPLPTGAAWVARYAPITRTPEALDRDAVAVQGPPLIDVFVGDPVVERAQGEPSSVVPAIRLDPNLAVADVVFPAYGVPGRNRITRALLEERAQEIDRLAPEFAAWAAIYPAAQAVVTDAESPYQATVLLENWFQSTFAYDETRSYGGGAVGPLPAFLASEDRAAHCQYFAGSMAVLLRMLGIPARVAVGFTGGARNGSVRRITDRGAHAWVEVRFQEAGWVPFEPTPTRRLPDATSSTSAAFAESDLAAGVGALAAIGRQRGGDTPGGPGGATGPTGLEASGGGFTVPGWLRWVFIALAVGLVLLGISWVLKQRHRFRARREDDPRVVARHLQADLEGWLEDQRAGTYPAATVDDLGGIIKTAFGIDAAAWAAAIQQARFDVDDEAGPAAVRARVESDGLRRRLRDRLTRRERVFGAVRPRRR
jgi:transglutaminase-like putative cysteine protease